MCPPSEPTKTFRFEILRSSAGRGEPPRFERFALAVAGDLSILEALRRIQDEQDPTLAFRYSCRGAVCGSCAMSINGKLDLGCRVQLLSLAADRVVLEPLPGFEVLKDLVVDMDPFWEKYRRIEPWLHAAAEAAEEQRVSEPERERIEPFVNCILCGLCDAACPVYRNHDGFTGPAALAALHRFVADSREVRDGQDLAREDSSDGVWGCHTITRCNEVCPMNVRPADGIRGLRWKLLRKVAGRLLTRR